MFRSARQSVANHTHTIRVATRDALMSIDRKKLSDFARIMVGSQPGNRAPASAPFNVTEYAKAWRGPTYVAGGAIARKIAMQNIKLGVRQTGKSGTKIEPLTKPHILEELFYQVNDINTQFDLWYLTVGWLMTTGNAIWLKMRNGLKLPAEIYPIPITMAKPIPSPEKFIAAWEIRGLFRDAYIAKAEDVVHMQIPSIDWSGNGRFFGTPPLAAAAITQDTIDAMFDRQYFAFKNKANPGLIFSTDQELDEPQIEEAYASIKAQWTLAQNEGSPIVVDRNWKVNDTANTPREMDWNKSLEFAMSYMLAIYGVPKIIVGLVADFSRANSYAAMDVFCENTVNPLLTMLAQRVTQDLASEYDPRLVAYFDPVTARDQAEMRAAIETAEKLGAVTPNEVRDALLGMAPFKRGGDNPIVMPTQTEATTWGNSIQPPEPPPAALPPRPAGQQPGANEPPGTASDNAATPPDVAQPPDDGKAGAVLNRVAAIMGANGHGHGNGNGSRVRAPGAATVAVVEPIKKTAGLQTQAYKSIWLKAHAAIEDHFAKALANALDAMRTKVVARLRNEKMLAITKRLSADDLVPESDLDEFVLVANGFVEDAYLQGARLEQARRGLTTELTREQVKNIKDTVAERFDQEYWTERVGKATRNFIEKAVARNIEAGGSVNDLADEIADKDFYGFSDDRAAVIARTESTAALNGGAVESMKDDDNVIGRQWQCVTPDTLVGARNCIAGARRFYDGSLFVIKTLAGRELSVTPEHKVLTKRGWVPANRLHQEDDLICIIGVNPIGTPTIESGPSSIGEIIDSAFDRIPMKMRTMHSSVNLDGNFSRRNGEIDVVWSDCHLSNDLESLIKDTEQFIFNFSDDCLAGLSSNGATSHHFGSNFSADQLFSQNFIPSPSLGESLSCRSNDSRIASVSEFDSCHSDLSLNGAITCALDQSNLFDAHSSQIEFDNIVSIEVVSWRGHVYDLSTLSGWFIANGVIVHNSTIDNATRETHLEADGQTRAIDEPFDVGGYEAMYPCDPGLPPEESVNCRCVVTAVLKGEEDQLP